MKSSMSLLQEVISKFTSGYAYVFLTIASATYAQITLKWQLSKLGDFPVGVVSKVFFMIGVIFTNYYILSVFIVGGISAISWMLALKALPLNVIYPMLSLCVVMVFLFSSLIFREKVSLVQIAGVFFIITGSILVNK